MALTWFRATLTRSSFPLDEYTRFFERVQHAIFGSPPSRLAFVFGSLLCLFVAGALFINLQTQKEFLEQRLDDRISFLGKLITDVSLSYLYDMRLAVPETLRRNGPVVGG